MKARFPDLNVLTTQIKGASVHDRTEELQKLREGITERAKRKYDLESLKDLPTARAYRDFFWNVGVDPTKTRPAAEALIRRILGGKPIPSINTLVDAYNLASIQTEVALAAFDTDRMRGGLNMRFAVEGEEFLGIGMSKSIRLSGGEVVISDEEKLIAIYPYRDAENTKVMEATRNVLLMVCGVPGISDGALSEAARVATEYVKEFCGGEVVGS